MTVVVLPVRSDVCRPDIAVCCFNVVSVVADLVWWLSTSEVLEHGIMNLCRLERYDLI
jgi:hypothetical protein